MFNPIPLNILRFRAKTMPQIKGKQQGVPNWHPLKGNRVKKKKKIWMIYTDPFQHYFNACVSNQLFLVLLSCKECYCFVNFFNSKKSFALLWPQWRVNCEKLKNYSFIKSRMDEIKLRILKKITFFIFVDYILELSFWVSSFSRDYLTFHYDFVVFFSPLFKSSITSLDNCAETISPRFQKPYHFYLVHFLSWGCLMSSFQFIFKKFYLFSKKYPGKLCNFYLYNEVAFFWCQKTKLRNWLFTIYGLMS